MERFGWLKIGFAFAMLCSGSFQNVISAVKGSFLGMLRIKWFHSFMSFEDVKVNGSISFNTYCISVSIDFHNYVISVLISIIFGI